MRKEGIGEANANPNPTSRIPHLTSQIGGQQDWVLDSGGRVSNTWVTCL